MIGVRQWLIYAWQDHNATCDACERYITTTAASEIECCTEGRALLLASRIVGAHDRATTTEGRETIFRVVGALAR